MKRFLTLVFFLLISLMIYPQQNVSIIWEADAKSSQVTFSPDGLTMYTGGLEIENPYSYGNLKKWDVNSGALIFTLTSAASKLLGLTNDIAVSPSGSLFASGHGNIYCVPPSGACLNVLTDFYVLYSNGGGAAFTPSGLDGIVTGVSFSGDGNYAAFGMRRTLNPQINVYRTSDYQLTNSFTVNNTGSYALSFSPVENILAAGMWEGHINLWNVESNSLIRTVQHGFYTNGGYPVSLAFSPDGSFFASAGNGYHTTIKIWNTQTGNVVHTLQGVPDGSADVAFSPNGEYIAAGFREYVSGTGWRGIIKIWRVSDGLLIREYLDPSATGNSAGVTSIAFSAIGTNWFAYTFNNKVKFAETDLVFNSSVPVELVSFTASLNDNNVLLKWHTASETNNEGFNIERKSDFENNWITAGYIEGKGNSTIVQYYEFTDKDMTPGKYIYRLRQQDFDGSFSYSNEVEVEITGPVQFALHQNYPNPFNPSTTIDYEIPEAGLVKLQIYDVLGNEVAAPVNENKTPGRHSVQFNAGNLSSGIYFSRLTVNNHSALIKLILSK